MAATSLQDLSEIVSGGVLAGAIAPSAIEAGHLIEPYPRLIQMLKKRNYKRKLQPEEFIETIGLPAFQAATSAWKTVQHVRDTNWVTLLERAAARHEAGLVFHKVAQRLQAGEDTDLGIIHSAMARMENNHRQLIPMSKVEPDKNPWMETGWAPLDHHIGGVPKAGLTLIGGPPGTGKTTLLAKLISRFVRRYKTQRAVLFSMEMTNSTIANRLIQAEHLTMKERDRILVCDETLGPAEVSTIASRADGAGLILVDFAELMLSGESSESMMANIYLTLSTLAKRLNVPVILLAQLNRTYDGSLPRMNMFRYTGMAEALASLALLVYNPHQIYVNADSSRILPPTEGRAYLIGAKSRYGWKHKTPGALECDWKGEEGWGDNVYPWRKLLAQ